MARRVIAIPLAVAIAIAVFSSFCFASEPDNIYISDYNLYLQYNGYSPVPVDPVNYSFGDYSTGNIYHFCTCYVVDSVVSVHNFQMFFDFSLDKSMDLYIPIPVDLFSFWPDITSWSSSLAPYYNSSRNLYSSFAISSIDYFRIDNTFSLYPNQLYRSFSESVSISYDIVWLFFDNVPADETFSFVWPYNRALDIINESWGSKYIFSVDGERYQYRMAGLYVTELITTPQSVVDSYISGEIPFTEALQDLSIAVQESITAAGTIPEKQLAVLIGNYELDRIIANSDNKSVVNVQQSLVPRLDQTLTGYSSGNLSLDDALSDMSQQYTTALNSAETPEQGIFINTTYQIKMQQLEFEARLKANAKMDSAITDEDLQKADEYYQLEDDIFSLFDLQELKDNLVFDQWYQSMSLTEAVSYKSIFDWFLNDSAVRYWLIVPISFIVIAILLSTTYRVTGKWDD